MTSANPVNRSFDLATNRIIAEGIRIIRATNFSYVAARILHDIGALDAIRIAQTNFLPRCQTEIILRRLEHEIVLFDVNLFAEWHLARAFFWNIMRPI